MKNILNSLERIAKKNLANGQGVGDSGFAKITVSGNIIVCEVKRFGGSINKGHYKTLFYKQGKQVSRASL